MDHVVGERVLLRTMSGGGVDDDGYPLPEKVVDEPIDGAVVFYAGAERVDKVDVAGEATTLTVLLPRRYDVELDAVVVVRGEKWVVDRPPFHHVSVFGSERGGTELTLRRFTG